MKNFLVIDDHEVVRAGIKTVFRDMFPSCRIHEASNETSAVTQIKQQRFDLVIMDTQMPDTNSFGLLEYMHANHHKEKVLVFSMCEESVYAKRFLKAGAMGFVSKSAGLTILRQSITRVLNGRKYVSEKLAEQLVSEIGNVDVDNPFDKLSRREFEIVSQLLRGKTVGRISAMLAINTNTVTTHKTRAYNKLGIKNLLELVELGKLLHFS